MKLSLSSLKTLDYKQLGIDHGEKVVIALIGLMMATVLFRSNWKGTDKTPNEITEKADKAMQQIEASPWPEKRESKSRAGQRGRVGREGRTFANAGQSDRIFN